MDDPLFKVRGVANYQFGEAVGESLFPDGCEIQFSRRTGRVRYISYQNNLLATIRAKDGRIVLTVWGARRLHRGSKPPRFRVIVPREIAPFVAKGRNVFAKHVLQVDENLRAGDEVLVVDQSDALLAVGKTLLCPLEMLDLSRGVAVRVRHGNQASQVPQD